MSHAWPIDSIRSDFPILNTQVSEHPLVYLDNAATAQKPQVVIDAISHFYTKHNANVHRGVHHLSEVASSEYEQARVTVQQFLGAAEQDEIILTPGTTASINLVAHSYALAHLLPGDEILLSQMEHHANIVPWQEAAKLTGATIKVAPLDAQGNFDLNAFQSLLTNQTKIVAITHASNVLGTITPIKQICQWAHDVGAVVLVDAAQSVVHGAVDVQDLNCDFLVFGAHKLYGPTGIGVLYAKRDRLEKMVPYQTGGNMISQVRFEQTTYADIPAKFEAGTPHIAGAIGLDAAIRYLNGLNIEAMQAYEQALYLTAMGQLADIPGLQLLGTPDDAVPVCSFVIEGAHAVDVASIINQFGVAVRSGHHCAMPLMASLGVDATIRASFAFYNTMADIDALIDALQRAIALLR